MVKIILASKSKVRKQILDDNNISTEVQNSNLDEDIVKESLIKEKASPELISKNLAKFLDINSGDAFSLIRLSLTMSSSKLEFCTSVDILLSSKICFLTLLFEASIILTIIFIYFVYFYN